MKIYLADSHAHLDLAELAPDRGAVLRRAREAGVALIVNVATGLKDAGQVVKTAAALAGGVAVIGVHPHGVGALRDRDLEALIPMAAHPRVAAVGEIGLDYYRMRSPLEVQQRWFRGQLELAWELRKPVVIHTREAAADTLAILREYQSRLHGGVMHCYGGSLEEARAFLDLGFYLSFSGVLTYPKADPLRQVARQIPLDRILIETDCPYLTPQPWRGKRNEPAYVRATAQELARVRGLTLEETAAQTWNNTLAAFGLAHREAEILRGFEAEGG